MTLNLGRGRISRCVLPCFIVKEQTTTTSPFQFIRGSNKAEVTKAIL